jgi:hypothetical protein
MKTKRKSRSVQGSTIQKFEDIFKDKNDIPYCLSTLRLVVPAVINESEEYLLKSKKGPLVAWTHALAAHGYIYWVNDEQAAMLLNLKFKYLDIKEASFRSDRSRVYTEYKMQFQQKLSPKCQFP